MSLFLSPSEMVTELRSRLGDPTTSEVADARILKWLNAFQNYIQSLRSDWKFCRDLNNTITTVNGTHTYTLGEPGTPIFSGAGLNDMTTGGAYTLYTTLRYRVQIDGTGTPNTFKWSDDGGSTWDATTVSITGSAQTLNNGVTVTFAATTGHTSGNYWDFFAVQDFRFMMNVRDETNDRTLKERDLDWLYKQDPTPTQSGDPTDYICLGPTGTNNVQQIRFWQVPNSTDTIKYDYYRWLPALETTTDRQCLIPDHELVILGAERRGRIDSEEPEDMSTIQLLSEEINNRLMSLIKSNTFSPNLEINSKPGRNLQRR